MARTNLDAWNRQKRLKEIYTDEEVPDIDELYNMISNIRIGNVNVKKQTMRARALFAMYYLTACRVSEIVRCPYLRIVINGQEKKIPHEYNGIRKKDIKFGRIKGKLCMLIRTENRKNKQRKTKRQPIPIELEKRIAVFIKRYIDKLHDDSILFDFQSKRATQIINQTTGFNVHFIRHIRATHLVTKYDFNEQALIKFMGWTDARPAKFYMELAPTDLLMQFFKR